eukprot:3849463-Alexandrium_andersonii.AAC.1
MAPKRAVRPGTRGSQHESPRPGARNPQRWRAPARTTPQQQRLRSERVLLHLLVQIIGVLELALAGALEAPEQEAPLAQAAQ